MDKAQCQYCLDDCHHHWFMNSQPLCLGVCNENGTIVLPLSTSNRMDDGEGT